MSTSLSPRLPVAQTHPTRQQLDELDALLQRMLALPVQPSDDAEAPAAEAPKEPRPPRKEKQAPAPNPPSPPSLRVNYTTPTDEPDTVHSEEKAGKAETVRVPREVPEEARAEAPLIKSEPPQGTSPDAPTVSLGPKAKESGEGWVPFKSSWEPSSLTWQPLKENWREVQAALRRRAEEQENKAGNAAPAPQAAPPAPAAEAKESPTKPAKAPQRAEAPQPTAPKVDPKPLPPLPDRLSNESAADGLALLDDAEPKCRKAWLSFNRMFDLCLVPFGALGRWLTGPAGGVVLGIIGVLSFIAAVAVVISDWIGWTW